MRFLNIVIFALAITYLSGCIGSGEVAEIKETKETDHKLPSVTGINLIGENIAVPDDLAGDLKLLTIAFQREQQKDVNTWIEALPAFEKINTNLHYYEIPVIYEMNALQRMIVNNGMRSGIPDLEARKRTITIYTDQKRYIELIDANVNAIKTVLLDQKNHIIWEVNGPLTEEKKTALLSIIQPEK